jgi:hypothetical protein
LSSPPLGDVAPDTQGLTATTPAPTRSAGIPLETRKALLGHANGDIATHYSAAELKELINAAEAIVSRGRTG